jgi:hypothetical protein
MEAQYIPRSHGLQVKNEYGPFDTTFGLCLCHRILLWVLVLALDFLQISIRFTIKRRAIVYEGVPAFITNAGGDPGWDPRHRNRPRSRLVDIVPEFSRSHDLLRWSLDLNLSIFKQDNKSRLRNTEC